MKQTKALVPAVFILAICIVAILRMAEQKKTEAVGARSVKGDDVEVQVGAVHEIKEKGQTRSSPKSALTIANALFETGHFQDALPYYQTALHDFQSAAQKVEPAQNSIQKPTQETIEFIQTRIRAIHEKIGP